MRNDPKLEVTSDFTERFQAAIRGFKNDDVLVGIPQDDNSREEGGEIGNAALLAINNFGSPANNIPPRPVMQIGIRNAQSDIIEVFRSAAKQALTKGQDALPPAFERIGIIGSNSIKKAINEQIGIDPPAASTLKTRKSQGFRGTKALIRTAQMRNAITYVVRGG